MLGINYYSRHVLDAPERGADGTIDWRGDLSRPSPNIGSEAVRFISRGVPVTAMDWEIDAPGLGEVLQRVAREYPAVPLYVTENGAAFDDPPLDGHPVIEDPERVAYLPEHIAAVEHAVDSGVDVRGYYVWSLFDNFEWEHGYARRFGIVHIDFGSQQRTPKRSALWYRDLIRAHSANGDG